MARAWVFDSNSGNLEFKERQPEETIADQDKRKLNIKNRLSGNAGLGSMFVDTNGGVQKTYAPDTSEVVGTTDERNLPSSVSTGRRKELTESERQLKESLKDVEGTTARAIMDRYAGLEQSLSNVGNLGTYNTGNILTAENFNKLLSGESTASKIASSAREVASSEAKKKLENIINPIESQYQDVKNLLSSQQETLEGTGLTGTTTDVASLPAKVRQAYLNRMSRLRETGLSEDVRAAQKALEEATSRGEELGTNVESLKSLLGSQASTYGQSEIGQAATKLASDYALYKQQEADREGAQKAFGSEGVTLGTTFDVGSYGDISNEQLSNLLGNDQALNDALVKSGGFGIAYKYKDAIKEQLQKEQERRNILNRIRSSYGL